MNFDKFKEELPIIIFFFLGGAMFTAYGWYTGRWYLIWVYLIVIFGKWLYRKYVKNDEDDENHKKG